MTIGRAIRPNMRTRILETIPITLKVFMRFFRLGLSEYAALTLKWKYVAGRDCSVRSNGCYGVWKRQQDRHSKCVAVNT